MTQSTNTKAPERIWAWERPSKMRGWHTLKKRAAEGANHVEYIRADLAPQWQPIETAPKDGSLMLACNTQPAFQIASVIYWDHGAPKMSIDGRWRASMHDIIGDGRFTHWMPLPTQPEPTQ